MLASEITGDLPEIIGNEENLYEGNLTLYFRILFYNSNNLNNPYHNFRHTLHVLWLCQKACRYYQKKLTPRQMRNLLIAALFHDFDHPGHPHPGRIRSDPIDAADCAHLSDPVACAAYRFQPDLEQLAFLYTVSTMHCMTVSLARNGEGLGAMWGEQRALEFLAEAGFTDVTVKQVEGDPFNNFYIAKKH
jgi:hypothetical protein